MRKRATVAIILAAGALGTWWFWPKAEPTVTAKRAATNADEALPEEKESEDSRQRATSDDGDAQALVAQKGDEPKPQDAVDPPDG